jgi:ribosomal protein S12 methylthiotransferase
MRGRVVSVLVAGPSEESALVCVGRHAGQAPEVDGVVYLDRPARPGSFVDVRITKTSDYDLYGEVIGPS